MSPTQIKQGQQSPDEEPLQSIFSFSNTGITLSAQDTILFTQTMLFYLCPSCPSTQAGGHYPYLGFTHTFAKPRVKIHISFVFQKPNKQETWF